MIIDGSFACRVGPRSLELAAHPLPTVLQLDQIHLGSMMLRPSLQVMKILLCRMRQRSFCKFFRLCYTRTCKPPASISEISSEFQIHMLPSLRRGLRPCRARFAGYQPRRAGPPTVYHEASSMRLLRLRGLIGVWLCKLVYFSLLAGENLLLPSLQSLTVFPLGS